MLFRSLSYIKVPHAEELKELKLIIPKKVVKDLKRLLSDYQDEIRFYQDESYQYYQVGTCSLTAKNIEGDYPNFRQVIPKEFTKEIQFSRQSMESLLRRIMLVLGDQAMGMKLTVSPGKLTGHAESPEMGDVNDEFEVVYEGEAIDLSYNPKYLIDIIHIMETGQIILKLNDGEGPEVLYPIEGNDMHCIIMPMKLK